MPSPGLETFTAEVELPYRTVEVAGAEHLVVLFPKLRPGGAPPQRRLADVLLGVRAHQLRVGSPPENVFGPARGLHGGRTGAALIEQEAARLGVPRENVIATGTSNAGISALVTGLLGEAGRIVVGGTPLRLGHQLLHLREVDGPTEEAQAAVDSYIAWGEIGDGRALEWFDRVVFDLAEAVRRPVALDLFVSSRDIAYDSMHELAELAEAHPLLTCRLTVEEYGRHGAIGAPFTKHVRKTLTELCGAREPHPDAAPVAPPRVDPAAPDPPYEVVEAEGAEHLVVVFPELRIRDAPPQEALGRSLLAVAAHQLRFAGDEHHFRGPARSLDLPRAVAAVVERERERLGVAPANVFLTGASDGAIHALMTGLSLGSGRIVAGRAAVRAGQWYDRLLREAAAGARGPLEVELVSAPGDPFHDQMAAFVAELEALPALTATLTLTGEPFGHHVVADLAERCGRREGAAPAASEPQTAFEDSRPQADGKVFHGRAALPYRMVEVEGAEHLIVFFPKLRYGGAAPQKKLGRHLLPLRAHQLRLGSDEHGLLGPRRELRGFTTAVSLIHREAERLGVPPENVITLGTSNGGLNALSHGLAARAGRILAGGTPVRMGTTLEFIRNLDGPTDEIKSGAHLVFDLADNGDGRTKEYLDEALFIAAAERTDPVEIDLFVSREDPVCFMVEEYAEALKANPAITSRLTYAEYEGHGGLGDPFVDFCMSVLGDVCGWRREESAVP